jgi:hypothetical protein
MSAGVRHVNETVVVKGREYQGNVFGGFRRSGAMTIGAGGRRWSFWSSSGPSSQSSRTLPKREGGKQRVWAAMVELVISCVPPHAMPAFVANP